MTSLRLSDLRSAAAIVISPHAKVPHGPVEQRIPAAPYACTTHVGPYEELGEVWARLMGEWLPRSGHRLREGGSYEIYRNTPASVPQEELETELCVPLV